MSWLVVLVLLSATGVVAIGLVSMWRALRNAEAAARTEARQAAQTTARALTRLLEEPAFLDRCRPEHSFEIGPDGPVVPAALRSAAAGDLPFAVAALLARAERLEFADGKPAAAFRLLERALARTDLTPAERLAITIRAAWNADRRSDQEAWSRLVDSLAEAGGPPPGELVGAALLLLVRAERPFPAWAAPELARLDSDQAGALLARLAELGCSSERLAPLERALATAVTARGVLGWAADRTPSLQRLVRPRIEVVKEGVLVYHPTGVESGRGALLPPAALSAALRAATRETLGWSGDLVFGTAGSPDRVPVAPGLWIEPLAGTTDPLLRDPVWIALLLATLTLCLVLGVFLLLKVVRREREAVAMRNDFLSSVSHELRTPLASIRMFAELLHEERAPTPERRRQYCALLASETARLGALVENVLDLRRMERGERSYDRRPVDLAEIVQDALQVFGPVAERAGIHLRVPQRRHDLQVSADRAALLQALLNVLDNAVKYGASGKEVLVRVSERDREAVVRVQDSGPGVMPEERERIFERFRRGRVQGNGQVPGIGLGLYLAREIARAHRGELACVGRDAGEGGAVFELSLPLTGDERR